MIVRDKFMFVARMKQVESHVNLAFAEEGVNR